MKELGSQWRSDIAALRGLSVLLVILNHVSVPGFSFGFIGVDLFFVISGYLITRSLYIEYLNSNLKKNGRGSIKILRFYLRRIRRLMPAAFVVILTTNILVRFLLSESEQNLLVKDSIASFFFYANVRFIGINTDYFNIGNSPSFLLHYWSLSIEEQFYLLIPLVILICAFTHRLKFQNRYLRFNLRLISLLSALTIGSFLLLQINFNTSPIETYFSLLFRAWELGVGAIFGILAYHKRKSTKFSYFEQFFPLLLSIVIASIFISPSNWARLLPLAVLATGFFLYAGENQSNIALEKTGRKISYSGLLLFLGKISYSLYLVHWPVLLIAHRFEISNSFIAKALTVCVSIILGNLLWAKIEIPFQRIPITKKIDPADGLLFDWLRKRKEMVFGLPFLLVLTIYFSTFPSNLNWIHKDSTDRQSAQSNRFLKPYADYESKLLESQIPEIGLKSDSGTTETTTNIDLDKFKNVLNTLTQANTLKIKTASLQPKLMKNLEVALKSIVNDLSPFEKSDCAKAERDPKSNCIFKSPKVGTKMRVALVGDSKMGTFTQPIIDYFLAKNWDVYSYSMVGCNPLGSLSENCTARLNWSAEQISYENFDLLIFTGFPNGNINIRTENYIANLINSSKQTILLGVFPKTPDPRTCIGNDLEFNSTCSRIVPNLISSYRKVNSIYSSFQKTNVAFIDTSSWSCIDVICPVIIDDTFTTRDGSHLSYSYVKKITPIFNAALDVVVNSL